MNLIKKTNILLFVLIIFCNISCTDNKTTSIEQNIALEEKKAVVKSTNVKYTAIQNKWLDELKTAGLGLSEDDRKAAKAYLVGGPDKAFYLSITKKYWDSNKGIVKLLSKKATIDYNNSKENKDAKARIKQNASDLKALKAEHKALVKSFNKLMKEEKTNKKPRITMSEAKEKSLRAERKLCLKKFKIANKRFVESNYTVPYTTLEKANIIRSMAILESLGTLGPKGKELLNKIDPSKDTFNKEVRAIAKQQ